jgi:hypothetical protein
MQLPYYTNWKLKFKILERNAPNFCGNEKVIASEFVFITLNSECLLTGVPTLKML